MKRYLHAVAILLVGSVLSPAVVQGASSPRALLVTGYGTYQQMGAETPYAVTVAAMQTKGWTVGSMDVAEVLGSDPADLSANWDVVWILPKTETLMHRSFSKAGSSVEAFVQSGGVVVMPGISTKRQTLDAGLGGGDVLSVPEPGSTVIHDENHLFFQLLPLHSQCWIVCRTAICRRKESGCRVQFHAHRPTVSHQSSSRLLAGDGT